MEGAGPTYCGNITVCVLINPMQVASCPDNYDKGRCVSMYFCNKINWENKKVIPLSKEEIALHSSFYSQQFKTDFEEFIKEEFSDKNPKFVKFINEDTIAAREIINL